MSDFDRLNTLLDEADEEQQERQFQGGYTSASAAGQSVQAAAQVERLLQRLSSTVSRQLQCETIGELACFPTEAKAILPALVDVLEHRTDDAIVYKTLGTMKVLISSISGEDISCFVETKGIIPTFMKTMLNYIPGSCKNQELSNTATNLPSQHLPGISTGTQQIVPPSFPTDPSPRSVSPKEDNVASNLFASTQSLLNNHIGLNENVNGNHAQENIQKDQQFAMIVGLILSTIFILLQNATVKPIISRWMMEEEEEKEDNDCPMLKRINDDSLYTVSSFIEDVCAVLKSKYTPYAINIISLILNFENAAKLMCSNHVPSILLQYASDMSNLTQENASITKASAVMCARSIIRNAKYTKTFVLEGGITDVCNMFMTARKLFVLQASQKKLDTADHSLVDISLGLLFDIISGIESYLHVETNSPTDLTNENESNKKEETENEEKILSSVSVLCCDKNLISTLAYIIITKSTQDNTKILACRCLLALLKDVSSGVETKVRMTQIRFTEGTETFSLLQRLCLVLITRASPEDILRFLILQILVEFTTEFKSGIKALTDFTTIVQTPQEPKKIERGKLFRIGLKNITSAFSFKKRQQEDKKDVTTQETNTTTVEGSPSSNSISESKSVIAENNNDSLNSSNEVIPEKTLEKEPPGNLLLHMLTKLSTMEEKSVIIYFRLLANILVDKQIAEKVVANNIVGQNPVTIIGIELMKHESFSDNVHVIMATLSCLILLVSINAETIKILAESCPEFGELLSKELMRIMAEKNSNDTESIITSEEVMKYLISVILGLAIFYDIPLKLKDLDSLEYNKLCNSIKQILVKGESLYTKETCSKAFDDKNLSELVEISIDNTKELCGIIAACAQIEPLKTHQKELENKRLEKENAEKLNTDRIVGLVETQGCLVDFIMSLLVELEDNNKKTQLDYAAPKTVDEFWESIKIEKPPQRVCALVEPLISTHIEKYKGSDIAHEQVIDDMMTARLAGG